MANDGVRTMPSRRKMRAWSQETDVSRAESILLNVMLSYRLPSSLLAPNSVDRG